MTELSRQDALSLLHEYTPSESLRKHSLAVEACMGWYAKHFDIAEEEHLLWQLTGLLHDFDYEKYPDPEAGGHPYKGEQILTELGYPEPLRTAIMGHALYTGVPRESLMAKTLFAVDELSGLIVAAALVRPDRSLMNLEVKSVKKKLKDKAFARGCSREDIRLGAEELGIELGEHIGNCITALRTIAADIGMAGVE